MAFKKKQRRETSLKRGIEYGETGNPWLMLAAQIFLQARDDAAMMKKNGETRRALCDHNVISKWEILNFLRSDWAEFLAAALDVSPKELYALECFVMSD